jgi:hypothetical protein
MDQGGRRSDVSWERATWGGGRGVCRSGVCALKPWRGTEGMASPHVYPRAGGRRDASGTDENSWRRVSVVKYVDPPATVAAKQGQPVGSQRPRAIGAPERILPRMGQRGSVSSFIGATSVPVRFWGRGCGLVFTPEPEFRADHILGGVSGEPMEILLVGGSTLSPP